MISTKKVIAFFIAIAFIYGGEVSARKEKLAASKSTSKKILRTAPRFKPIATDDKSDLKIEHLPNGKVKITESDQTSSQGKKRGDFSYSKSTTTMIYSAQHAPEAIARAKARAAKAAKAEQEKKLPSKALSTQPKKPEVKVSQRTNVKKKFVSKVRKGREATRKRIQHKKPAVQRTTIASQEKAGEIRKKVIKRSRRTHVQSKSKLSEVKSRIADRRSLRKKKTPVTLKRTIAAKKTSDSKRNPKKGPSVKRTLPTAKKIAAEKKNNTPVKKGRKVVNTKRATPHVNMARKAVARKNIVPKPSDSKRTPGKRAGAVEKPGAKKYNIKVGDFPSELKPYLNDVARRERLIDQNEVLPDNMILPPATAKTLRAFVKSLSEFQGLPADVVQRTKEMLKIKYGFEG